MRYAVLAFITMIAPPLSGCLSQEPPNLGSSSDPAERLSNWRRCLETSYAEARKKPQTRTPAPTSPSRIVSHKNGRLKYLLCARGSRPKLSRVAKPIGGVLWFRRD